MTSRVLLVEDDALLARQLRRLLTRGGYNVTHVSTCAEAHAIGERFELAVIDGELPDGYGSELYSELFSRGIVTTGVFFTGSRETGVVIAGSGLVRCVAKVEGVGPLLSAMAAALAEVRSVSAKVAGSKGSGVPGFARSPPGEDELPLTTNDRGKPPSR